MKKLLLILLCLPFIGFGQKTYVPDDNFEQKLIQLGYDNILDDSVLTSNISAIPGLLYIAGQNITDLTGIEDFTDLEILNCENNQLISLDVSNNINLNFLVCRNNNLHTLDIRNGNNNQFDSVWTSWNPNLTCISVDDSIYSTNNWTVSIFSFPVIDSQHYFSNNCSQPSAIQEHTTNKELLKVTDLLGRETKGTKNEVLFYIYDDGTVEKRIVIE